MQLCVACWSTVQDSADHVMASANGSARGSCNLSGLPMPGIKYCTSWSKRPRVRAHARFLFDQIRARVSWRVEFCQAQGFYRSHESNRVHSAGRSGQGKLATWNAADRYSWDFCWSLCGWSERFKKKLFGSKRRQTKQKHRPTLSPVCEKALSEVFLIFSKELVFSPGETQQLPTRLVLFGMRCKILKQGQVETALRARMTAVRSLNVLGDDGHSGPSPSQPRRIAWSELQSSLEHRRQADMKISWADLQEHISASSREASPELEKKAIVEDDLDKPKRKKTEKRRKAEQSSTSRRESPGRPTQMALAHMLVAVAAPSGVGRDELNTVKGHLHLIGEYDGYVRKQGKTSWPISEKSLRRAPTATDWHTGWSRFCARLSTRNIAPSQGAFFCAKWAHPAGQRTPCVHTGRPALRCIFLFVFQVSQGQHSILHKLIKNPEKRKRKEKRPKRQTCFVHQ